MKIRQYFGIEISNLKAGDIITAKELVRIYEENTPILADGKRKQPMWAFLISLRDDIESTLLAAGKYARCVQRRNDLHLIQGAALSEKSGRNFEDAISKAQREAAILGFLVDTSKMNQAELESHNRTVYVCAEQVSVLKETRNKLGLMTGVASAYAQLRQPKKQNWEE